MFDVCYKPRKLTDYVAKFTTLLLGPVRVCHIKVGQWKVFIDEASNAKGSGVGIVLVSPEGIKLERSLWLSF